MMFVAASLCAVGMIASSIMAQQPGPAGVRPGAGTVGGGGGAPQNNTLRPGTGQTNPAGLPANPGGGAASSGNMGGNPAPVSSPATGGTRIVVVEMAKLMATHPEYVLERQRAEASAKELQEKIKIEMDKINDSVKGLEILDPTSLDYRNKAQELARYESSLRTNFRLEQETLQMDYMKKVAAIFDKINLYIDKFAQDNKISIVLFIPTKDPQLPAQPESAVAWYQESLNITPHIEKMILMANRPQPPRQ